MSKERGLVMAPLLAGPAARKDAWSNRLVCQMTRIEKGYVASHGSDRLRLVCRTKLAPRG